MKSTIKKKKICIIELWNVKETFSDGEWTEYIEVKTNPNLGEAQNNLLGHHFSEYEGEDIKDYIQSKKLKIKE